MLLLHLPSGLQNLANWEDFRRNFCPHGCQNCHLVAGFDKLGGFQKDKEAEMLEGIPLQRFGTKWDIAMACVYLASKSQHASCPLLYR